MRVVTIKIEEDLLKEIDEYAEKHGLYRTEVIRLAIREFLRPNTTTYKS
ncbi:MAG: ribbon-helix-helix protein, CopG family [Candidatus Nanopusillus sp.]|nr:ribbon-helix-helix protein, CopG family [Candidatus Nanopusillus sp.]